MVNAEKYHKDINIIGVRFGVNAETHEPMECPGPSNAKCLDCEFRMSNDCEKERVRWLIKHSQTHDMALQVLDACNGQFAIVNGEVVECDGRLCRNNCELYTSPYQCTRARYCWLKEHGFIK